MPIDDAGNSSPWAPWPPWPPSQDEESHELQIGWIPPFCASLVLALAVYSRSVPGLVVVAFLATIILSLAILVIWLTWFISDVRNSEPIPGPGATQLQRFGTPALVSLALFVTWTGGFGLPMSARFLVVQPEFDDYVSDLEPEGSVDEWHPLDPPGRIGGYGIVSGYQVGDATIVYESNGVLLDDAGFAYLPSGPSPAYNTGWFEGPEFRHITGHWYSWTASW